MSKLWCRFTAFTLEHENISAVKIWIILWQKLQYSDFRCNIIFEFYQKLTQDSVSAQHLNKLVLLMSISIKEKILIISVHLFSFFEE